MQSVGKMERRRRRVVKGMRPLFSRNPLILGCWQERGSELNDDLILDCCQYFAKSSKHGGVVRHVALCSGDKNLCIKAESVGTGFLISICRCETLMQEWER